MADAYRQQNGRVWTFEPPPRGARYLFLPTAILGALGTVGFGSALLKVLMGQGRFNPVFQLLGLCFSLLMLVVGVGVIAYRAQLEVNLTSRLVTVYQRALGFARSKQYPLEEFDHIAIVPLRPTPSAPFRYSMVYLNGPNCNPSLLVRSEHGEAAMALAQELSEVLGLPVREHPLQEDSDQPPHSQQ